MRLLIAAPDRETAARYERALGGLFRSISITDAGRTVRRAAAEGVDCVLVCCPLTDERGEDAALRAVQVSDCACVVVGKELPAQRLEPFGIPVLPPDAPEDELVRTVRLTLGARARYTGEAAEDAPPRRSLDEIHLINRAKEAVMSYLGFSEEQAHRYLERQAMDMRISKAEAARRALRMYPARDTR